jgi:hypothetical protein
MDSVGGELRRRKVRRAVVSLAVLTLASLSGCSLLRLGGAKEDGDATSAAVAGAAGWTRTVTTRHYLMVVNVLPGEAMFSHAEHMATHATEGELIIDGDGMPLGQNVRHVEAHIYDIRTGLAVTDAVPSIVLTNRSTGEVTLVPPTLMQDVNIGELDRHYGNNVHVSANSDISVKVSVHGEEVSVDGHLD